MMLPLSDTCDDFQAIIDHDDDDDYYDVYEQEISTTTAAAAAAAAPLLIFVSAPMITKNDIEDIVEEIKEEEGVMNSSSKNE
eukprot:CAMPEP_0171013006 /NCGR_PEP_ID=MMETSP0736-20130129/24045_1 /TAXON_ID=186038 /ORGANISM="Fragilariopsis kerguelensis, Strain L26-C5" /LENGTH=81 /DNA_ID=CAMNT_0011446499 /DNA_START=98 /DNA_END=343 /DNA_ORIENTATION=+